METVSRTAIDPETGLEYQIEMPAPAEVIQAILELPFPPDGMKIKNAVEILEEKFGLSEAQKNAGYKGGDNIFYHGVQTQFRNLLEEDKLKQPEGSGKSYFLVDETDPAPAVEDETNQPKDILTPDKSIKENYQKLRAELANELLQQISAKPPAFFEKLVIDLLVKIGYGGSLEDAKAVVGRSGDGGIDGIIKEDLLGLDVVYVQAKRLGANVGEPPIRDFVGALDGKGAQKGVFIATSDFTASAKQFAETSSKKIVLINGTQLVQYMIDHNVGVSTTETYELKRIDSDYFAEEE